VKPLTHITQIDFKRVAHFYGQGATYDAIEGRFRKVKKLAKELVDEAGEPTKGGG
jgi:hypothetical protein